MAIVVAQRHWLPTSSGGRLDSVAALTMMATTRPALGGSKDVATEKVGHRAWSFQPHVMSRALGMSATVNSLFRCFQHGVKFCIPELLQTVMGRSRYDEPRAAGWVALLCMIPQTDPYPKPRYVHNPASRQAASASAWRQPSIAQGVLEST